VIAGTAEAELSFRGAVGDLPAADGPFLVFDIGGGSTEFVVGSPGPDGVLAGAVSRNIGSVRITERVLHADPPTADQVDAARSWAGREVASGLDEMPAAAVDSVRRVVAVAGTATTVAADALSLPTYDPAAIHLSTHTVGSLRAVS